MSHPLEKYGNEPTKHFILCLEEPSKKKPVDEETIKNFQDKLGVEWRKKLTVELLTSLVKDYLLFRNDKFDRESQLEKFLDPVKKSEVEKKAGEALINELNGSSLVKSLKSEKQQNAELLKKLKSEWKKLINDDIESAIREEWKGIIGANILMDLNLKKISDPEFLSDLKANLYELLTPKLLSIIRNELEKVSKNILPKIKKATESLKEEEPEIYQFVNGLKYNSVVQFILDWERILNPSLFEERKVLEDQKDPVPDLVPIFDEDDLKYYEKKNDKEGAYEALDEEADRAIYRMYRISLDSKLNRKELRDVIKRVEKVEFVDMDELQCCHEYTEGEGEFALTENQYAFDLIHCRKEELDAIKVGVPGEGNGNVTLSEEKDSGEGKKVISIKEMMGSEKDFKEVVVAVLDSGVDFQHPSFANSNILIPGKKYSVDHQIKGKGNCSEIVHEEFYGHGTHVTGIIQTMYSAMTDDYSVDPKLRIKPYKVFPNARKSDIIRALVDAANSPGVHVINNSWGPTRRRKTSPALDCVVNYIDAMEKEVVLVFSAGNSNDDAFYYAPARSEEVVTVGAINKSGGKAQFSNYGKAVDIAAPGQFIWSYRVDQAGPKNFGPRDGTSMAAPFVSTAMAMLYSRLYYPGLKKDIKEILRGPDEGEGNRISFGPLDNETVVLDVRAAFERAAVKKLAHYSKGTP